MTNIIIWIDDDKGKGSTEWAGNFERTAETPVMTQLANTTALVLGNFITHTSCSPSRASCMTGRNADVHGIGHAIGSSFPSVPYLTTDLTTIFQAIKTAAPEYATAYLGKNHITEKTDSAVSALGADYYDVVLNRRDHFNSKCLRNGVEYEIGLDTYYTTHLTDIALDWINDQTGPWVTWIAGTAPHKPFTPPPSNLCPDYTVDEDSFTWKKYHAALQAVDTEFGRLIDGIDLSNTIVIVLSDNGAPFKVASAEYRDDGTKGSLYEGGISTPAMVFGTGVRAGLTDNVVSINDIFNTVIEVVSGAEAIIGGEDSKSFVPLFTRETPTRVIAESRHFDGEVSDGPNHLGRTLRDNVYSLVIIDGELERLYDCDADPYQDVDLLENPTEAATYIRNRMIADAS